MAFGAQVSCPVGGSSLRPVSDGVGALRPLSRTPHPPSPAAPYNPRTGSGVCSFGGHATRGHVVTHTCASMRRGRLASGSPRLSETPLRSPLKSVTIIKYKYTMILTGHFLRQITQLIYPTKHILSNTFYILSIQKFHIIPNLCYTKKATALIKLIRQGREVDQRVYTKFTA